MAETKKRSIPLQKTSGSADVPARLRALNRSQRHAVLATDGKGQPYTSLVAFALTDDASGIIVATPKKTRKYRNIIRNNRVSLLIDTRTNSARGYLQSEAMTILGTATPVRKSRKRDALAGLLVKKHPALADFVQSSSTALVFVTLEKVLHVGRFQIVSQWSKKI